MSESLFTRLGGESGIRALVSDLVENHYANPTIKVRFENADKDNLKQVASTFMITGTGGPACYEGKDMVETHKNMNISAEEFMAVLDDALNAMAKHNVGEREQQEVLFTFYSMRNEVMKV